MNKPLKRLYRCTHEPLLGGVCAGMGEYFELDPALVRILWVIFSLISMGAGIIAYFVGWIIIPKEPLSKHKP